MTRSIAGLEINNSPTPTELREQMQKKPKKVHVVRASRAAWVAAHQELLHSGPASLTPKSSPKVVLTEGLEALINYAEVHGFELEIRLESPAPLKMGNKKMRAIVTKKFNRAEWLAEMQRAKDAANN